MKRPWSYGDDMDLERERKSQSQSHRRLYLKVDDRRRRNDSSSGLAYDRRKGEIDRNRDSMYRSESFSVSSGLRRDCFPKGFRSERDRHRRDGRSYNSWHRLRGDELDTVSDKHGRDSREERHVKEKSLKEEAEIKEELRVRESLSVTSSDSEMEEGELEPETEEKESQTGAILEKEENLDHCDDSSLKKKCQDDVIEEEIRINGEEEGECEPETEDKESQFEAISEKEENFKNCDIGNGDSDSVLMKNCLDEVIEEKLAMNEEEEGEFEPETEEKESRFEAIVEKEENFKNCVLEKEENFKNCDIEKEENFKNCDIEKEENMEKNCRDEVIGEKLAMNEEEENSEMKEPLVQIKILPEKREEKVSNGETQHETETEKKKPSYKDKGKGLALEDQIEKDRDDYSQKGFNDPLEDSSAKRGFDLLMFRSESSKSRAECNSDTGTGTGTGTGIGTKICSLDLSLSLPGISSDSQIILNPNLLENNENSVKSRPLFVPVPVPIPIPVPVKNDDSKSLQNVDQLKGTGIRERSLLNTAGSRERNISNGTGSRERNLLNGTDSRERNMLSGAGSIETNMLNTNGSRERNMPNGTGSRETNMLNGTGSRERHTSNGTGSRDRNMLNNRTGIIEKIVSKIVYDPLHLSGRMLLEMKENSISYLKHAICEIVTNSDKKTQLNSLQKALNRRSDLTTDNLPKCPRPLLEILTVLKTGNPNFTKNVAISNLVDILCDKKCRNISCGTIIPVDNCDCKICKLNPGFCSDCMCIICRNFDSASNTCSWVGCDSCMHWCHTNCALNNSLIKPGIQIPVLNNSLTNPGNGIRDLNEMMFVCEGCGHASEMFGFVKEVFRSCGKVWEVEVLVRELGFVRKIFRNSEDFRGRRLKNLADKMVELLQDNKGNRERVVNYILGFLSDLESNSNKDQSRSITVTNENSWSLNPNLDVPEQKPVPVIDELDHLVKLKQAEAKMYQEKSNDAKKEAEGLKQIIISKNKRIDEEYYNKIEQFRLKELEERREKKLEELRVLEKEYKMFFGVKVGMESEIRDLMVKLEGAKPNFQ